MSFRIRLLLTLIISPFVALFVFMFLLTKEFEQDKIAYIFELQDETLKRVEAQVAQVFMSEKEWTPVFGVRSGVWVNLNQDENLARISQGLLQSAYLLCQANEAYTFLQGLDSSRYLARCLKSPENELTISVMSWTKLSDIFRVTSFQDFYLVHFNGTILFTANLAMIGENAFKLFEGSESVVKEKKRDGRFKTTFNNQGMIGTQAVLKDSPLILLSMTPTDAARRAAYPFIAKGFFALLIILLIIFVVGHFLSYSLVKKINVLLSAFQNYGAGQENLRLPVIEKSRDEFQKLNIGFNNMADQIRTLVNEKQATAANEHEMKLAGDVQRMFFPKEENLFSGTEVLGFVWPASQCGGDWWHAFEVEDKLVVILGDVTGHGFTSALMTSAGRAVVASIESTYVSLEELASSISRTLYSISHGSFQMTFCGIELNRKTHQVHVLNCSHEPPIFQFDDGSKYMTEGHGPRLGEKLESEYKGETFPADNIRMISIYSDGLREITNEKGKILGERRLLKTIDKAVDLPVQLRLKWLQDEFSNFKGAANLNDDVCLVSIKFK